MSSMMKEPPPIGPEVKFGKGLIGLFKKGCWEIPEIMGSSFMAVVGLCLAGIGVYNYIQSNGDCREYKNVYFIVRDGDPRGNHIKNPVFTEYGGGVYVPPKKDDDDKKHKK